MNPRKVTLRSSTIDNRPGGTIAAARRPDWSRPFGRKRRIAGSAACLLAGILLLPFPRAAWGQEADKVPPAAQDVGVTEHLGDTLPMDATFKDAKGETVRLGDFFTGQRPVLLTLNYYSCPMLCTLQLNGLVSAMKGLDWTPGQDYVVLSVSFDPSEQPELAAGKKSNYLEMLGQPDAANGWRFLTGEKQSIVALTNAVGFRYRWDEKSEQWVHPALLVVVTPEGRISRYLYGLQYEPNDLRFALVEAGNGKLGSTLDRVLLYCFHYDADVGGYTLYARNIMTAGSILVLVLLGGMLGLLWWREVRRRRRAIAKQEGAS
jgi:protein SCO1/2